MPVLRHIALLGALFAAINPAFAQDTSCCDQLRKEVQVLKEQQDKIFKELKQDEVNEKKNFTSLEDLMGVLSNKFPDLKDTFKKLKDVYDQLGKTTNP
jgi:hypothetical protein